MKLANSIFAIGIGVYYVFGVYTSMLWSDFYYSIVFGYICSLICHSKMLIFDKRVSLGYAFIIWIFYMVKQFIDIDTANWIRYVLGIIFVPTAIVYYLKSKGR